jgi:omega-hydroxy-beta-dihydromenaquinone-9 sulfotransferase
MHKRIAYPPDGSVDRFERAVTLGTGQLPASSAPLLFVTGASRSGTTMLARMLGSHSAIMAFNEMHYFGAECDPFDNDREISARKMTDLAATLLVRQTHGLWGGRPSDVERAWAVRLVHDLPEHERSSAGLFAAVLRRLSDDAGKSIACEQTPRNIFYAKQLLDLYPNARIIHIVRDPRAVLASQKNRWQLKRLGARHLPTSEMIRNRVNYHPYTMGKLWAKATDEALALDGHPRFLMVRFEDLAADPSGSASRLCSFLGLHFEPGMLDIPRWGSSNLESSEQTGVSSEVVNKWRESLSRGELWICEMTTKRLMQRLGYMPEFLGAENAVASLPSLIFYPFHVVGVVALNPVRAWIHVKALLRGRHGEGKDR